MNEMKVIPNPRHPFKLSKKNQRIRRKRHLLNTDGKEMEKR
jgi:hypothetical protein